jgi:DNA-directed RNA polymerase subunit L
VVKLLNTWILNKSVIFITRFKIIHPYNPNSILSIKNGNDNVRIEDNCLEEELATTPILSEIRTLSLTFVMLMRFLRD